MKVNTFDGANLRRSVLTSSSLSDLGVEDLSKVEWVNSLIKERLKTNKKATIISAYHLRPEEIDLIKRTIPELSEIEIEYLIDKELLAGIVIKIGSLIIDQSLLSKINQYFKNLYEAV